VAAGTVAKIFQDLKQMLLVAEVELGELDAIAGDGDHGRGMAKGVSAAQAAAESAFQAGSGVQELLFVSGNEWAAKAGGTSGALWGAALKQIGTSLGNDFSELTSAAVLTAMRAGFTSMKELGKASVGDKTMLDAYAPFLEKLEHSLASGSDLAYSFEAAAAEAAVAAKQTASLVPKVGRARPLAEKSVGTPDPGAVSLAMCLQVVAKVLKTESEGK
jgi:dihydroxyacetone kinase